MNAHASPTVSAVVTVMRPSRMTFVGWAWRYAERAHSTALPAGLGISRWVGWDEQVLLTHRISKIMTRSHIRLCRYVMNMYTNLGADNRFIHTCIHTHKCTYICIYKNINLYEHMYVFMYSGIYKYAPQSMHDVFSVPHLFVCKSFVHSAEQFLLIAWDE